MKILLSLEIPEVHHNGDIYLRAKIRKEEGRPELYNEMKIKKQQFLKDPILALRFATNQLVRIFKEHYEAEI